MLVLILGACPLQLVSLPIQLLHAEGHRVEDFNIPRGHPSKAAFVLSDGFNHVCILFLTSHKNHPLMIFELEMGDY